MDALLALFERCGIPVPDDDRDERIEIPNSLLEACRIGVEPEIANTDMYDRLLAAVLAETDAAGGLEVPSAKGSARLSAGGTNGWREAISKETGVGETFGQDPVGNSLAVAESSVHTSWRSSAN